VHVQKVGTSFFNVLCYVGMLLYVYWGFSWTMKGTYFNVVGCFFLFGGVVQLYYIPLGICDT